jgi:DmsE family decaheme c-type cytochrome
MVVASVGLCLFFVGRHGLSAHAQATGQIARETVVGEKCERCHSEIVASFALDLHGKSAKFLDDPSLEAKCEKCHGDGKKHMRTRKPEDILNPAKLSATQANESCLQCHSRDRDMFDWRGGRHERTDMSCLSCHSAHHAKSPEYMLASLTAEEGCFRCHKDQRKAQFLRSTHLFRTENRVVKVGCASCHNPHGGEGRKMLQASSINETCYQCHAEKRGPFLWEHDPAQENCLTCHTPHGSNQASLLTARSHQLCQQCHVNMLPRHSTVAGFGVFTFNRGCVNCHSQIHGSNHPSGRAFTR